MAGTAEVRWFEHSACRTHTEVADLDLWASDTDDTSTRTKNTAEKFACADLRISGRPQGLQQVCDPGMAVAIQLHPTHISRGTQTVQGTKRLPSFTARQAVANQTHQRRHNPSAVTSHNQLQPDSAVAQMSKASAAGIHRVGAHQAARSSEKPTSQNSHPNLPTSCSRLQLQLEQQHKLKLAALREEKEAQDVIGNCEPTAMPNATSKMYTSETDSIWSHCLHCQRVEYLGANTWQIE
ncbi:hypothetical protein WJX79_002757 [Trebouxia sp. C0005]